MKDIDYIKKFSKISIAGICRKYSIDTANLWHNKTAQKKVKLIKEEIESEIAKLYIKEDK